MYSENVTQEQIEIAEFLGVTKMPAIRLALDSDNGVQKFAYTNSLDKAFSTFSIKAFLKEAQSGELEPFVFSASEPTE